MLTIKETAERLRFTEAHVRKLLREKKIKGKKAGRMWLVPLDEVNKFLGIESDAKTKEKDVYIKDLENKVESYEAKFTLFESLVAVLEDTINRGVEGNGSRMD